MRRRKFLRVRVGCGFADMMSRRKMAFSCKNCLLIAYVIPLLLLTVLVFIGTLVLGIIGIGIASEANACIDNNNSTNCVNADPLTTSLTDRDPLSDVSEDSPEEFLYWLAGATACGILFAVIATLSLWALEDVVRRLAKIPKQLSATNLEMEAKGESVDPPRSPTPEPVPFDMIDGHEVVKQSKSRLQKLNCGSLIALFFGCLFGILALLCLLWAIAVGVNHSRQQDRTVTPFIVVELLAAVFFPFLFFTSGIFIANVIDFITYGVADAREALPRFLNAVKFKKGEKSDHWVIENTLYFDLKKREKRENFSCYPNFATWILVAIVSLAVNFSVSYFADIALDKQVSVTSCSDPRIDSTFSCFNSSTLAYVDCINDTAVEFIHCFKFYRFGVDVDLIQSIATAYAVYLVAAAIFGHIFLVMKVLLHLTKQHILGGVTIVLGLVMFFGSVALILVWLSGYISAALSELSRLNVINLAQFVMVSLFVLLIGLLMVSGTWAGKKTKPKQS